ncbi:MAG: hypothetical protein R2939_06595 [Kofleriaceae bacterium]
MGSARAAGRRARPAARRVHRGARRRRAPHPRGAARRRRPGGGGRRRRHHQRGRRRLLRAAHRRRRRADGDRAGRRARGGAARHRRRLPARGRTAGRSGGRSWPHHQRRARTHRRRPARLRRRARRDRQPRVRQRGLARRVRRGRAPVNASRKRLGRMSFLLATARATLGWRNPRVRLRLDDGPAIERAINTIAIANGGYFGGGMHVAPDAVLDDGVFDVVTIGPIGLGDLVLRGTRIYRGRHVTMPQVEIARARVVTVEAVDPATTIELDLDGEDAGRLPVRATIVPAALTLVTPS